MSSTNFFRSARFLDGDGFGKSTLGLVLVAILMAAWIAWFFFAPITVYKVTDDAYLEIQSRVVADFPPAALIHIRPNQPAQFRLHDFPWTEYGSLSAAVTRVTYQDGRARVELGVQSDTNSRIPLQKGLTGTVVITVDQVSPAALVLHTSAERLAQVGDDRGE
jgi:multidrug resistance efflux pump